MSIRTAHVSPARRLLPVKLVFIFTFAGCSLRPYTFGESATNDGATGTTSPAMTTTGAATTGNVAPGVTESTTASASSSTSTGGTTDQNTTTAAPSPDLGVGQHCSVWDEDCPEGQKCMPHSADGDLWLESTRCVDIVPDPDGLGEPCMVLGPPSSGEDTCDKHMLCLDIDPATRTGTCYAMCLGSSDAPYCADPDASCDIKGDGILIPCRPGCDPLDQDCETEALCLPNQYGRFWCYPGDDDDVQLYGPCEFVNACGTGLYCANPMLAAECDPMAIGCCIPFCDVTQPNTCPGQGQQCVPWHKPGEAPPGLEHVGACVLPAP